MSVSKAIELVDEGKANVILIHAAVVAQAALAGQLLAANHLARIFRVARVAPHLRVLPRVEALRRFADVFPQNGRTPPSGERPQAEQKQYQRRGGDGIFHGQTSFADVRPSASDSVAARLAASYLLLTIMVEVAPS